MSRHRLVVLVLDKRCDVANSEPIENKPASAHGHKLLLHRDLAVNGVEVVIDRDARNAHRVADVFDRSTQGERTALVE